MHAYLVMAHNNFSLLEKLILMLDDAENDIYIHIDKKSGFTDYDGLKKLCRHSNVFFAESIDVKWGDFTQVECELGLLKMACKKEYDYLHLLSGVCMPIKSQREIHSFFAENAGKEFLFFKSAVPSEKELERIRYYHFFLGRRNLLNRILTKAETTVQRILGVDRIKGLKVGKGANWFSITSDFAKYIIENEEKIRKQYKHTISADEFFVQTLALGSSFGDRLYCTRFDNSNEQNMRLIDWTRGTPYTFGEEDIDEIMDSGMLFVRKLTEENKLPDMIFEKVMGRR